MTGGYAGGPGQHLDYDTTQEHAAPNTISDLAFRGVLAAGATAVWRGMIRVDPGAQQTDAFQESRNLLLSPEAHADAIPGLEIEADDVRCTHAAAIAQIDRDQLFYLTSRGLDPAAAKQLIIEGFLESLVERLAEGPVRDESLGGARAAPRRDPLAATGTRNASRPPEWLITSGDLDAAFTYGRETGKTLTRNLRPQSIIRGARWHQ